MTDPDCVAFLQWALPRLHMRWAGFRKVRKRVCKRLARRLAELDLPDLAAYRERLAPQSAEWEVLDGLCRVVISRYFRDRLVFNALAEQVLPALAADARARGAATLRCWSLGSASGEEPYTLAIVWRQLVAPRHPGLTIDILGTEVDPQLLARADAASYAAGTVRNLPEALRAAAFDRDGEHYRLRPAYRALVRFERQDVRGTMPDGPFDLILCRNLVFTYFDEPLQHRLLASLLHRLAPGGWLVLGVRERLPLCPAGLMPVSERLGLYRKASAGAVQHQGAQQHIDR